MIPFAAATGVQAAAALAAAVAAACALALPSARGRLLAMPGAWVLPARAGLAVAEDQVREQVSGRAGLLGAAAVAGMVALVLAALIVRRWPAVFVVAAVAMLPVRIPVGIGGDTANLLLPLYGVLAAGVLAALL